MADQPAQLLALPLQGVLEQGVPVGGEFGIHPRAHGRVGGVAACGRHTRMDPEGQPAAWTQDPDDDYLLVLAVAARADAIVTGDRDLTETVDPPLPVLTPRVFLDRLNQDA